MRLSTYLASAAVLFAFGVVGFRIIDLEQRVAQLTARADQPEAGTKSDASSQGNLSKDYESRLRALEQRIGTFENLKEGLPMASGNIGVDRLQQEQAILSVVERENSRIREVQLEWHKARWLDTRKQQLAAFAFSQKLEPAQTSQ